MDSCIEKGRIVKKMRGAYAEFSDYSGKMWFKRIKG